MSSRTLKVAARLPPKTHFHKGHLNTGRGSTRKSRRDGVADVQALHPGTKEGEVLSSSYLTDSSETHRVLDLLQSTVSLAPLSKGLLKKVSMT